MYTYLMMYIHTCHLLPFSLRLIVICGCALITEVGSGLLARRNLHAPNNARPHFHFLVPSLHVWKLVEVDSDVLMETDPTNVHKVG
jgi:hypothetical protein